MAGGGNAREVRLAPKPFSAMLLSEALLLQLRNDKPTVADKAMRDLMGLLDRCASF